MLTKRIVTQWLDRKTLLMLIEQHKVTVKDKRSKQLLIEAILGNKRLSLAVLLKSLSLNQLVELRMKQGVTNTGRGKEAIIQGLLGSKPSKELGTKSSKSDASATKKIKKTKLQNKPKTALLKKSLSGFKKLLKKSVSKAAQPSPSTKVSQTRSKKLKSSGSVVLSEVPVQAPEEVQPSYEVKQIPAKGKATLRGPSKQKTLTMPITPKSPGLVINKKSRVVVEQQEDIIEPKVITDVPEDTETVLSVGFIEDDHPLQGRLGKPVLVGQKPLAVYQPPEEVPSQTCQKCHHVLSFRKCQVQRCDNIILEDAVIKICAECLFERNTISMTEFYERLEIEKRCPYCQDIWQKTA